MKKVILYTLATLGGVFLTLLFVVFLGFRSLFYPIKPIHIEPDSQLYIHLSQQVGDFPKISPIPLQPITRPNVWDIDKGLRFAAEDPKITSAFIHIDFAQISLYQAYALGQAIAYFKSKGKQIDCYASSFGALGGGLPTYLLASYCDSITIQRLGEVAITSLGSESVFLKNFFDKWKIVPDFIGKGRYKSAPEMYTESTYTSNNREVVQSITADIEAQVKAIILHNRANELKLSGDILKEGPYIDVQALQLGLVDRVYNLFNIPEKTVDIQDYIVFVNGQENKKKKVIALIPLEGAIIDDGVSHTIREQVITPQDVKAALESAKKLGAKAIVFSINSPGGSALASEKIASIIKEAQRNYKIVVYMQRAAASGGYYISASADHIVSNPFTFTGSIGVFLGKFAIGDMLKEFGINTESLDSSSNATILSAFSRFTPQQRVHIQKSLDHTYNRFIEVVAEGRKKSKDQVLSVAEGRVWTGLQAKGIELVDEVGTLNEAILKAAELSQIAPSSMRVELIKPISDFPAMLKDVISQLDAVTLMLSRSLQYVFSMVYPGYVLRYESDMPEDY